MVYGNVPDVDYNPYHFVYILTGVFLVIAIIGLIMVPKGPNSRPCLMVSDEMICFSLYRLSIVEAAFFMWLAWVTIYCSQLHPMQNLAFSRNTLVWMSHYWGNARGVLPIDLPTTTPKTGRRRTTTRRSTRKVNRTTTNMTTPDWLSTLSGNQSTTSPKYTTKSKTTTTKKTPKKTTTTTTTTTKPTIPTTRRPWYYRTYRESNHRKQYFPVYGGYIDFSVKVANACAIYLTVGSQSYRSVEIHMDESRGYALCKEMQFIFHTFSANEYPVRVLQRVTVFNVTSGDEWRRFFIDLRNFYVVRFGRYRGDNILICRRQYYESQFGDGGDIFFRWHYLDHASFYSFRTEADWLFHRGVGFDQISHYGGKRRMMDETTSRRALRSSSTQVLTLPDVVSGCLHYYSDAIWENSKDIGLDRTIDAYIEAKANYKFYPAIYEPIEFGVLVERQVYREFYVLLSTTYKRVEPCILIHIGSHQGRACTITRNWEVVRFVKCKLDWQRYFYLQFWVYYSNGTISVKAGYSTPDPYPAFISWTDPNPFEVVFYGLRTVVGTEVPMSVIEVVHPEET